MCVFPSAPTKRRIGFLVVFINSSDRRICFLFRSAQENGDGGTKGKDTRGGKKKKQMRKRNEKKIHTKKKTDDVTDLRPSLPQRRRRNPKTKEKQKIKRKERKKKGTRAKELRRRVAVLLAHSITHTLFVIGRG